MVNKVKYKSQVAASKDIIAITNRIQHNIGGMPQFKFHNRWIEPDISKGCNSEELSTVHSIAREVEAKEKSASSLCLLE